MKNRDANASYDPLTWEIWDSAGSGSADEKAPHPHILYPELPEYRRIDSSAYFDPKSVDQEWQQLWTQTWTCAGRISDLPTVGSWFRYDIGKESFIIARGHDDQIHALYNVCQHRGRQLVDGERGQGLKFVCPFHSWAYDLAGKNIRVTDRQMFDQQALCGDVNLKSVRCETWAGFIFISMNPQAPALLEFLGDLTRVMKPYQMEDMHVVRDVVLSMDCNWKVGLEAFLESYHLHATHPQAMPATEDYLGQFDIFKNGHARHVTAVAIPSVRLKDQTTVNPLLQYLMMDSGIDPASFNGTAAEVRNAICDAKRNPDNRFGLDYSKFTDSQITDDWNYFVFPNMTLNSHPEGILIMRFLPHPTDPNQFNYHVLVIMPKLKDGAKAPFYMGVEEHDDISGATRPERIHSSTERPQLGEVLEQDISNIEAVQRGLKSKGFAGGMRYAEHELRIQVLHAELNRYINGAKFQSPEKSS